MTATALVRPVTCCAPWVLVWALTATGLEMVRAVKTMRSATSLSPSSYNSAMWLARHGTADPATLPEDCNPVGDDGNGDAQSLLQLARTQRGVVLLE